MQKNLDVIEEHSSDQASSKQTSKKGSVNSSKNLATGSIQEKGSIASDELEVNYNNLGINNSRPSSYNTGRESEEPSREGSEAIQVKEME